MTDRYRCLSLALLAALACAAAGPATVPTTQQSRIGAWLAASGDAEPMVRESARTNLLGLTADELPLLLDAAKAAKPLRPAQIEAVREAVIYVRTRAALMQLPNQGAAFMGVLLSEGAVFGPEPLPRTGEGVPVISRLPGFAAARYLENGDAILGFVFDQQTVWFDSRETLIEFVRNLQVGRPIRMLVRRAGRSLTITLPLDGRPTIDGTQANQALRLSDIAENAEAEAVLSLETDFSAVAPAE